MVYWVLSDLFDLGIVIVCTIENYPISNSLDKQGNHFKLDKSASDSESCKVKMHQLGKLDASFLPDSYSYLYISNNPELPEG